MNKYLSIPAIALGLVFSSCIGEEPLNAECDIEAASLHVDNAESIFYHAYDTLQTVSSVSDSIGFLARPTADISAFPLTLKVTEGAKILIKDGTQWVDFVNGSSVDFSGGKDCYLRVISQNGAWHRDYKVCVALDIDDIEGPFELTFNFDKNYKLNDPTKTVDDKQVYFVWQEDSRINTLTLFGEETWKCGNPGFKLSKSSAKPMEYPSVPVLNGGPDGTDCVKLETMDTGAFGKMVKMLIASGSLFTGYFDVANALKDARKATQFGLPFRHKPTRFTVWLKCDMGDTFQDKEGKAVVGALDEPDAYVVVYRNQDENGKQILLDGDDILTSKYIVGMARLPHNYTYEEVDGRTVRRDLVGNAPIHGVTNEWKEFVMDIEYSEELDNDILANKGYSMVIGFASSWQGAYFQGAVGSKLWIDNIKIDCEY